MRTRRTKGWKLWKYFEIPDYDGEGNYLTRLRIVETPWCGVFLHKMDGPDPRPTLHDHPWSFVSFVLAGGYTERRLRPSDYTIQEAHEVRRLNVMRRHDFHSILSLRRVPTWTLVFIGKRRRTWGYLDPYILMPDGDVTDWVWTEFCKHPYAEEFDAAMERREANSNHEAPSFVKLPLRGWARSGRTPSFHR